MNQSESISDGIMSEPIVIKSETTVPITPRLMAEAFWAMSDGEQAEFFHQLADVVRVSAPDAYGLGEMQWCYMADAIKGRSLQAREMYLAFSGFAYEYWPLKDIYSFKGEA